MYWTCMHSSSERFVLWLCLSSVNLLLYFSLSLFSAPSVRTYVCIPAVCTEVVGDSSGTSTVALFNKAVQIFVEMLSNPPPRLINTIVTLFHNRTRTSNISISQVNVVRFGGIRLIWRFVVQVPELSSRPDEAVLKLEAHFRHKQFISCGDRVHVVNIPVRRDSEWYIYSNT